VDIDALSYSPETGILTVKCRGRFGVGSEGNPSSELLTRTIEDWILNHGNARVTEIEVDYADVNYSWGDGPVSSMVPFLRQGVARFHLIASPSNHDALKGLLKACNLPWFVLSRTGNMEVTWASASPPSMHFTVPPGDQTELHPDHLDILADAISDVGYWRRWVADLPERVELEFGGVQLAATEIGIGLPRPITALSLRFLGPSSVAFIANPSEWERITIIRGDFEPDSPESSESPRGPSPQIEVTTDWPLLLQQRKIGPLAIQDMFTLHDVEIAAAIIAEAHDVQDLVGTLPAAEAHGRTHQHTSPFGLALRVW
jgi:hypothetical protein